jgi:hypothetical protein
LGIRAHEAIKTVSVFVPTMMINEKGLYD